ncbi:LacI family DNA-binding transcriptional regulator [Antribacter gilvus]|uniref:LacI family DNA-binding transcriptional regulator n=1 Tax=Antribacter gilvus TaxID=2304675 RepID=UPI000F792C0C|nr:LacI family DNA-binding transcriptional regulator [Antribacter gilvus]
MSDVAHEAGVSKMTVSNVINGRPGASDDTRERVLAAVERLGYRVNTTARHLRAGRTGAIGLLVPHLDGPYYAHLAARLDTLARARGHHVIIERTGASREGELEAISPERVRPYDGLVFSPVQLETADLSGIGVPLVLLGERRLAGPFDHVMMDNVGGADLATTHLIERGSRRLALVGGRPDKGVDSMATLRTRGYRQAHSRAGLPVDEQRVVDADSFTTKDGYEAVMRLHREQVPFDGVVVLTDAAAMGVLRALADIGRRVPDDVQVVGFDNDVEGEYLVPRLTTIDPDNDSMAARIMELLFRRVEARAPLTGDAVEVVTSARLVVRESTRPRALA